MDLLGMLADAGMDAGSDYHDGLEGYFSWSVSYENGFRTLSMKFDEYEMTEDGFVEEIDSHTKKYRLVPVEG